MVAVIHDSRGFHNVLNYNEQKVIERVAVCLEAANYPKVVSALTFNQKLRRLENLAALNERAQVNCIHISLNFDPSERLSDNTLKAIATDYMQKIGFGEQPWLLYRHDDAGHPHVHIVTTIVKANGKRIDTHNLGKKQSEKARKEIELAYGLLRPEDSKQRRQYELSPVNVQKVQYGKSATKRAITNILSKILKEYKYTSLPELNAVLRQYNIVADRGSTDSRIYKNNGLTYSILDTAGKKVGVPIKASDFYNKPTLTFLEERFKANEPLRQPYKAKIRNAIDMALLGNKKHTLPGLIQVLGKEGIQTVIRENDNGMIYGVTYIDYQTKCVFNGSDLGKQYSAKMLQERCLPTVLERQEAGLHLSQGITDTSQSDAALLPAHTSLIDTILRQEYTNDTLPFELKKTTKKKRKGLSNNQ